MQVDQNSVLTHSLLDIYLSHAKHETNDQKNIMTNDGRSLALMLSCFQRMSIVSIIAREILDSRGNPTVEVDLRTNKGESIECRMPSWILKAKEYVECVIYNVN